MNNFSSFKNFSYVTAGRMFAIVFQAIFYLLFAALLEPERYGELNYFIALAGTTALISRFGLNFTITVFQAKENSNVSDQINTLAVVSISAASLVLLFIDEFAALLSLALSFFMMNQGNLLGLRQYKKFMYNSILRNSTLIGIPIVLYFALDIPGVLLGMAISNIIACFPFFKILKIKSFSNLKKHSKVIIHNFGVDASTGLSATVDKLLIAPLFGFLIVGIYQFNLQILVALGVLPTILYSFLLSEESRGVSHKKITYFAIGISCLIAGMAFILAPTLVNQFFPKYEEGIFSLQIIVLSVIPMTISSFFTAKLQAVESTKIGFTALVRIGSLLLLIVWLGQLYDLIGLSLAVLLSITANTIFSSILYFKIKK